MIESHWDGIASYCHPENKVSLGLVEGVNNKIRVLQRRAYGYRDEEYLKLKIVAAFLPPLPRNAVFKPTRIRVDPFLLVEVFRADPTPRCWQRRTLKPHHLAAHFELETST